MIVTEEINGNIGDMRFVLLEITVADPEWGLWAGLHGHLPLGPARPLL